MYIDARELASDTELEADICIIGGGAAGIAVATQFAGLPLRVALLESGGQEFDYETQLLYDGDVVDDTHFDLTICRLRQYGGTTNHWSGTSRPFGDLTFRPRPGLPDSGWTLPLSELEPYFKRAHSLCRMEGPYRYDMEYWGRFDGSRMFERLDCQLYQRADSMKFNQAYDPLLKGAKNVTVYFFANGLEFESNEAASQVKSLTFGCLNGKRHGIKSRYFVLSSGGIENARLLLLSDEPRKNGLGNDHDVVGRYYSEHPAMGIAGEFVPSIKFLRPEFFFDLNPERNAAAKNANLRPRLTLKPETVLAEQLNQCLFDLVHVFLPSAGVESTKALMDHTSNWSIPDGLGSHIANIARDWDHVIDAVYKTAMEEQSGLINTLRETAGILVALEMEQSPNPESRVSLSDSTDFFGQRKVTVDWRMNSADKDRARRAMEIFAAEVGAAGLGRVRSLLDDSPAWPDAPYPDGLYAGWHQMGTTRLHDDPKKGVVNRDCRVHGVENLFVAGSSVFPTVGIERPTMNIVALGIRLSDHLKSLMEIG